MLTLWIPMLACTAPEEADPVDTAALHGPSRPGSPDCAPGEKRGEAAGADDLETPGGVRFTLRLPEDYDPTVAHALVVVFAPAGGDPEITEDFTGLTGPLTRRGYAVAYADHAPPVAESVFEDLGRIPRRVARRWCIDEDRVHFTGHSDGGSVATALAVYPELASIPAASIAPSAAGTSGAWFAEQTCPPSRPVMVLHSRRDGLFPGYGAEAAAWWSSCNGCEAEPGPEDRFGCVTYGGCTEGAEVRYCEHSLSHGAWPDLNPAIRRFFDGSGGS